MARRTMQCIKKKIRFISRSSNWLENDQLRIYNERIEIAVATGLLAIVN